MKSYITYYFLDICLLFLSCSQTTTVDQPDTQQRPLSFSISNEPYAPIVGTFGDTSMVSIVQEEPTKSGDATTANLTSFGIFSFYTGTGNFDTNKTTGSLPNSMCNVNVGRTGGIWSNNPKYYWPHSSTHKMSFFAYAPHSSTSGGAITVSPITERGVPTLTYTVPSLPSDQIDLLLADGMTNLFNTTGVVNLLMRHVLAKIIFQARRGNKPVGMVLYKIEITGLKGTGNIAMQIGGSWTATGTNTAAYTLVRGTHLIMDPLTTGYQQVNFDNSTLYIMPQTLVTGQAYIKFTAELNGNYRSFTEDLSTLFSSKTIALGGNYLIRIDFKNNFL